MRLVQFVADEQSQRPRVLLPDREVDVDLPAVGYQLNVGVPESMRALLTTPRWRDRLEMLETHAFETETSLVSAGTSP